MTLWKVADPTKHVSRLGSRAGRVVCASRHPTCLGFDAQSVSDVGRLLCSLPLASRLHFKCGLLALAELNARQPSRKVRRIAAEGLAVGRERDR